MAAMVNMNSLLNGKDSRWLQLEVCREFQRNKCSRQDTECKFAHPPANVEVQNGKVTACYDSIKGRCNRDKPPCKYFHPPQHLKDQLLINGRNHLALKNALMQQMGIAPGQPVMPGQVQTVATNPYLTGIPANTYSPYFGPGHLVPAILGPDPSAVASQLGPVVSQAVPVAQQKLPRSDRLETAPVSAATLTHPIQTPGAAPPPNAVAIGHPLEVGKKRAAENDMFQLMDVKTVGSFYYENFAFSGMVPFKRPAGEKSGIPVYQPGATTYQQLMQLQQPFVPVSSSSKIPLNASYVTYTDANGQLLDTLPVCQDFNRSMCSRLNCRFVHLTEDDKVEVCDQRVAVCRDHANGQCRRKLCKYYHIPVVLPPANIMATIFNQQPAQQPLHHPNPLGAATTISLNEQKQQEQLKQQQLIITTNASSGTTAPYTSISSHHNNNNILSSLSNNTIYKNINEKKNTVAPYQSKTLSPTTLLRQVSSSTSKPLTAQQNFTLASPQSPKSISEPSNIYALTTSTNTMSTPVMTTSSNLSTAAIAHVYTPTFEGYFNAQQHLAPAFGYYDILNQGVSNSDSHRISVLSSNPTYIAAPLIYTSKSVSQPQHHDSGETNTPNANISNQHQHHSSVSNLPEIITTSTI